MTVPMTRDNIKCSSIMHRLSNVDYLTVVEKLFRRSERIVVAVVVVERIEQE